jgi:hypothetical protein
MTVYLIGGVAGVGKTSQIYNVANIFRPTRWAAFELKDKKLLERLVKNEDNQPKFEWELLNKTYPAGHVNFFGKVDEYQTDPVNTLNEFERWVHETIAKKPKTVVVDGISELRNFAKDEWIYEDNEIKIANKLKPRRSIGEQNLAAWGEINDRVKDLIVPLMQYGYENNSDIFFTTQMKEHYIDGKLIGEVLDIKKWVEHEAEVVMVFNKESNQYHPDADRYWVYCKKIPAWVTTDESKFAVDLRKNDGLLEVLTLHGFIH